MAYPNNTPKILEYMTGYEPEIHYSVSKSSTGIKIDVWDEAALGRPKPTDQEVIDEGNSSEFAVWYAEHGGDADLTRRRIAKELIDKVDELMQIIRATIVATNARTNQISLRVNQILDAIDSANNLAQMQSNIGAIADLPEIQKTALKTIILGYITSGETDGSLED